MLLNDIAEPPASRTEVIVKQMEQFFFGEGATRPAEYVPPAHECLPFHAPVHGHLRYAPYFPLGYSMVTSSLKINTQFITRTLVATISCGVASRNLEDS